MWRLVLAFADIALHRRSPADLPASRFLFALSLVVYLMVGLITIRVGNPDRRLLDVSFLGSQIDIGFVGVIVLETAVYLGFVWLVLRAFERPGRFLQTATALVGVETLISLIGIPVLAWIDTVRAAGGEPTAGTFVYLLLFLWSLDVAGFIISKAIQNAYFVGVLIVIGYFMVSFALREQFLPVSG